jgi:hypothetical protein
MDVMSSICMRCHVNIHMELVVLSIRTDVDHLFFTINVFWLKWFLQLRIFGCQNQNPNFITKLHENDFFSHCPKTFGHH